MPLSVLFHFDYCLIEQVRENNKPSNMEMENAIVTLTVKCCVRVHLTRIIFNPLSEMEIRTRMLRPERHY